jgi:hypothetical protein
LFVVICEPLFVILILELDFISWVKFLSTELSLFHWNVSSSLCF